MDIKEIALKVARNMAWALEVPSLRVKAETIEHFAEALIAEIAKQNEPVAWARYPKFTGSTQRQEVVFKKPDDLHNWVCLYTIPPTSEQIANETAEAIALMFDSRDDGDGFYDPNEPAEIVRSGAWKEFKK